jgi:hypothetical protein
MAWYRKFIGLIIVKHVHTYLFEFESYVSSLTIILSSKLFLQDISVYAAGLNIILQRREGEASGG